MMAEMKPIPKPATNRPATNCSDQRSTSRREQACTHHTHVSRGDLKDTAEGKDETSSDDGHTTTEEVGDITCHESAKECTGRKDGGHEGLLPSWDGEGCFLGSVVWITRVGRRKTGPLGDEVWHG